jgi:hypothetical protein
MADIIHVSRSRILKDRGPVRRAYIEHFPEPVRYGMHGGVQHFYGLKQETSDELPTTLDHLVAAVAG